MDRERVVPALRKRVLDLAPAVDPADGSRVETGRASGRTGMQVLNSHRDVLPPWGPLPAGPANQAPLEIRTFLQRSYHGDGKRGSRHFF